MEKPLAVDMSQLAQQTYAEGSLRLHELVVEKNGKLDPDGVKKALKIVEGMTPRDEEIVEVENDLPHDFGSPEYSWTPEQLKAWVISNLQIDPATADKFIEKAFLYNKNTKLMTFFPSLMGKSDTLVRLPNGMIFSSSVSINNAKLKMIPAGIRVRGALHMKNTPLKPKDISRDIWVEGSVYVNRERKDLDDFFVSLGIKVAYC